MVNKYMIRCQISFMMKEMHIKITMLYHVDYQIGKDYKQTLSDTCCWHDLFRWHFHNIYLNFKYIHSLTQKFHFQKSALEIYHIIMQDYILQSYYSSVCNSEKAKIILLVFQQTVKYTTQHINTMKYLYDVDRLFSGES